MATEPGSTARLLSEIALDLASSLEPKVVIQRVLKRSLEHLKADRATLSSIDGDELYIHGTFGRDGEVSWIGRAYPRSSLTSQEVVARALDQRGPAVGAGWDLNAAATEFRQALEGVKHTAAVPLIDSGEVFGLIVLSRYDDVPFADSLLPSLAAVGQGAALALRNAEAYRALQAAKSDAEALADRLRAAVSAAEDIAAQGSVREAIERLLVRAREASDADAAAFAHLEGDDFVIEAATRAVEPGARYPVPQAMRVALRAGEAVHVKPSDHQPDDGVASSESTVYEHVVLTPLIIAGEIVGIVILARTREPSFSLDDVSSVQHFGTLGALLVENERLRKLAQHRSSR